MSEIFEDCKKFRVKRNWDREGDTGICYGVINALGRVWAIVLFDSEEDPDFYKAEAIEIETHIYKPLIDIL